VCTSGRSTPKLLIAFLWVGLLTCAATASAESNELAGAGATAGYHQINTALAAGYIGVVTDTAGTTGSAVVRQVESLDACDPATFNDPTTGPGPGTCNRPGGGVTFSDFIGQLQDRGQAPAWRFSPGELSLASGGSLQVTNRGGEDHTPRNELRRQRFA
jgi:hypothetical protein